MSIIRFFKRFPFRILLTFWIVIILTPEEICAQEFGRNKPGYKLFDYKVYETPNFEIYHYLKNDSLLDELARRAEEWYRLHQRVLKDTIEEKNPIIFYSNHSDFQETSAVSGTVSVGTGGVTEALKRRVILPVAATNAQTDHVLGHELVHAFQYHMIIEGDSTNLNNMNNLPLWMVEGMAEYLSIGSVDPHTAMWMRDAILNDDFPTLKQLSQGYQYFPYRWGQAFWSLVAKAWGEEIIAPIFLETAKIGYEKAIEKYLNMSAENFSALWKTSTENYYRTFFKDSIDLLAGEKILFGGNAGDMNLSPSISPDGKQVVFLSEREVISLDLFLADVETGEIIRKLTKEINSHEVDALNYLESAGTWSPDGTRFAFSVFEKGENQLIILNAKNGRIVDQIFIPGVPAFNHPSWSPDGESILVAGIVNGESDLYRYYIGSGRVDQITDDRFSYIHPSWSPDGRYIVVSTDKREEEIPYANLNFNLALIDLENENQIEILPLFHGAKNLNPLFSSDGKKVYFLSDCDGFRNLYLYELETGNVYRLTDYLTGISGITHYSPAISIARESDEIAYSYYFNGKYSIYTADLSDFEMVEVSPDYLDLRAGTLPPAIEVRQNLIDANLEDRESYEIKNPEPFIEKKYKPKFKLDYISNVSIGTAINSNRMGTGMAGSVFAIFGDMVGNNQMYVSLAINGEVYDFGGQVAYMNQKRRLNWGASVSHIPYQYVTAGIQYGDTLPVDDGYYLVDKILLDQIRIFEDRISMFAYLPFSTTRRMELGASQAWYYYRIDRWETIYDAFTGYYMGQRRKKLDAPDGFNMQRLDIAYVTDNSVFGFASPLSGHRSRLQIEKYFGEFGFFTTYVDLRKYFRIRPLTLAARAVQFGRYGRGAETGMMSPIYLGYPWFIRGYDNNKIYDNMSIEETNYVANQLYGSQIVLGNVELRIPVTGPKRMAPIKMNSIMSELALFLDAGMAWTSDNDLSLKYDITEPMSKIPVYSVGASLRLNLMGAIVIEPYYAWPFQGNGLNKGSFGINFIPGW